MPRRLGSTHAISIWDSQQRAGLGAASRTNPRTAPTSRMPFPGVASSPSHSQQPTPATQRAKRECGTVPLCWPQCAPSACHPSASRCLDPGVGVSCRGLCRVLVVGLSESEVQVHSPQRNAENDTTKKRTRNIRNNRQGISGEHDQEKPTIPPSGKTPRAPIMLPAVIALKGLLKLNSLVRNLGQCVAWLRRSCAVSRDAGRTTKVEGNAAKETKHTLKRLHARSFCLGGRGLVLALLALEEGPGGSPAPTTRLAFLPTTACKRSPLSIP